jgi:5-methylcytosine-specific restriction endonuclease McrA
MENKKCPICENSFPATTDYFYMMGNGKLFTYCKPCASKKADEWQKNNHDKMLVHFDKENKKPSKIKMKRELSKKRRLRGEDKIWQQNNKEKIKEYNKKYKNKRHNITKEEWDYCLEYFNHQCAYCGITEEKAKEKYKQYLHKEHVDHNGNSTIDNCVPACKSCNSLKWTMELIFWYKQQEFFNQARLEKIYKWINGDYKYES